jgi:hypothetical protein
MSQLWNVFLNAGNDRRGLMRNRAKCKLCNDVIEVLIHNEYVSCKCGEITLGPDLYAKATDFKNFLRIGEKDEEISVQYKDKQESKDGEINDKEEFHAKPTKEELLSMLDDIIKSYESMPSWAIHAPISHADQLSLLMLVSSLFKSL